MRSPQRPLCLLSLRGVEALSRISFAALIKNRNTLGFIGEMKHTVAIRVFESTKTLNHLHSGKTTSLLTDALESIGD